ncbi:MAG: hypothetical protein IPH42_08890 [Bacteroidetes bacterium]|nr:hypothetical protein [Bacteroidota bacterium]
MKTFKESKGEGRKFEVLGSKEKKEGRVGKGLEGFAGLTRLTGLKRFNAEENLPVLGSSGFISEENLQGCLSV